MEPGRDYRVEAEQLRDAARAASPERRGHLLTLAGLYEDLAKANERLAGTRSPQATIAMSAGEVLRGL